MRNAALMLAAAVLIAGAGAALAEDDDQYAEFNKPGAIDSKVAPDLITGSRIGMIVAALQKAGFEVEVNKTDSGVPRIDSTNKEQPFSVHFYGCTDGEDCGYIQFLNGWNMKNGVTAVEIEQWNTDQVWGQAFRDEEKDPWVGVTVNLRGGVTQANFDDTVEWWARVLQDFQDHIGWDKE
ncbi:MAG TPA: YbjN domain-containing protein [Bauldia sp.]|nr:YbjN domain-containing protein [Bauldia sp.]